MNETLMHYGVKGQSCGKRNFQYEDGTLTAEGKERYSKGLTRSGASVFRSGKPKIGQQVWTAKRSMTKVGDLPEETKEKLLERVRQARQGGADSTKSGTPEMTREATKSELSPEEREKLKETTPKTLGTPEATHEVKDTKLSPEEREKLKEIAPKSLGMTQEMAKADLSKLSPEEQEKLRKKRAAAIKPVEPKKAVTMGDSTEDSLMHYGILGMKWGVRRYQNKDGTWTEAGKKRYDDDGADNKTSSSGKVTAHEDYLNAHSGKSLEEYSTKELQAVVNRLNFEQQYNKLTSEQTTNGKKVVSNILGGVGGVLGAATPVIAVVGKHTGKDTTELAAITGAASAIAVAVSKIIGSGGSDSSGIGGVGTSTANLLDVELSKRKG